MKATLGVIGLGVTALAAVALAYGFAWLQVWFVIALVAAGLTHAQIALGLLAAGLVWSLTCRGLVALAKGEKK